MRERRWHCSSARRCRLRIAGRTARRVLQRPPARPERRGTRIAAGHCRPVASDVCERGAPRRRCTARGRLQPPARERAARSSSIMLLTPVVTARARVGPPRRAANQPECCLRRRARPGHRRTRRRAGSRALRTLRPRRCPCPATRRCAPRTRRRRERGERETSEDDRGNERVPKRMLARGRAVPLTPFARAVRTKSCGRTSRSVAALIPRDRCAAQQRERQRGQHEVTKRSIRRSARRKEVVHREVDDAGLGKIAEPMREQEQEYDARARTRAATRQRVRRYQRSDRHACRDAPPATTLTPRRMTKLRTSAVPMSAIVLRDRRRRGRQPTGR